jgi:hypothetical protein
MNPGFRPPRILEPLLGNSSARFFKTRSILQAPLQIIVNHQVPQNQYLQKSIKTNSFNSFAINTYKKQGGGGVMVNQTFFRSRDVSDVRTSLEKYGIGWTMWDYSGGFGIVTKENGQPQPDEITVKALGRTVPRH